MEGDEPSPATLIYASEMRSNRGSIKPMNKGLTTQGLEPRRVVAVGARHVHALSAPVAPACDVVESLVHLPVFEVLGGHQSFAAGGIHEVVEGNVPGGAVANIVGSDWSGVAFGRFLVEDDVGDPGLLENGSASLLRVAEQDLVELGADDVVGGVVLVALNEVGV